MAGKPKTEKGTAKGAAATGVANRAATAQETAERHRRVVEMRIAGATWEAIQEETGLAPRTSRDVWRAWSDAEKVDLVGEDPLDVVAEHISGLRQLRVLAAEVYEESEGTIIADKDDPTKFVVVGRSPSARVGALRLMMDLRAREIDLRQDTGLLPRNLGKFKVELDVRYIVGEIVNIMVEYDMPPEAQDKLLNLLEREPPALEGAA